MSIRRLSCTRALAACVLAAVVPPAFAAQLDIEGPPGSAAFGSDVILLPNFFAWARQFATPTARALVPSTGDRQLTG